uniref:titin isoform X1 n=1 Tax=Epinephelus lanceolatus TaxID=310571 RepID=UPI0014454761|nr:titin isoform X1 [Epinephelus lanceolatus]
MEVHIQTQADVESHIPTEAAYELQQDLLDQIAKPVLPCDTLQTEAKEVQDNNDALENQASKTPSTKEEPDDLTESISKPQLSDIPEEATPASATEEAARDDTIAEDLIEITSEVFTAPEPLDITQADETEMISAVSQLSSESSKTSGNTTPVPAEYDFLDTEVLLNQVVDNISVRPKAVPVCSDEQRSERIVVSVSHQILETFVSQEEPTIQETQRGLDATTINTVLNVQEVIAIDELAATTQTDSISEVIDSISTEIASEVLTEDFDTAEIAIDEIHEVNVTHQEDSLKELESIDEYHHVVECLSEVNTAVSTDILPEGDETFPDNGSLVGTHQAETEPPKIDYQEADSAATVADETKDGAKGQEVPTLTEKEDQIMHKITEQIQIENKDQPPVVKALQELAAVQAAPLDSEESRVQSLEKDIISENIPAAETVAYELKEEMVLTEVNVGHEKRDEMETDASKTVRVQEPEVLQAVQTATLDSEEGSVQSPEEGIKSENISVVETVTEEPQEETILHTEVKLEPTDASKPEHAQEPEVLQAVQAATFDSEGGSVQLLEKDVISEDRPVIETFSYKLKEETVLSKVSVKPEKEDALETDAAKPEHVQASEAVQASTLDSEEVCAQSPKEEVKSEDNAPAETVTDEAKQTADSLTEVTVEPESEELPVDAVKTVQDPEVSESVQPPSDSEESSVRSLEKDVISVDIPVAETVTYKFKEKTVLAGVNVEPEKEDERENDIAKPEHVQLPEASEPLQASTVDLEESSVQTPEGEVKSKDIPTTETVTDEPKQTAENLSDVTVEPQNKELSVKAIETVQEPEAPESVQASTDSEEGSVQSLQKDIISVNVPTAETDAYKLKEETVRTEVEPEKEDELERDTAKPELPEASEPLQASTLDSEESSVQTPEGEVKSKDIPTTETVTDEPKQTAENLSDVTVEPQNKELSVKAIETVQEPEAPESVQASTDSEEGSVQSLQKDIISVNVPTAETDTYKLKEETVQTEVNVEPEKEDELERDTAKPELPEASEPLQASSLDSEEGSGQSPEEVKSEDISPSETLKYELKKDIVSLTEVYVESEKEAELETDAAKPEQVEVPEAPEAAQASTLDSEQGSIQSPEQKAKSEDIPRAAPVTDEAKQTAEHLTEITLKPENKELPVNAVKTVQEQEVSEAIHATTDSEGNNVQLQPQVISEDVPEAKTTDENELKKETILLTIVNREPLDADKTKHVQVTEASEAVTASILGSEDGSVQSPEEKVKFEDISKVETITNESKEDKMPFTEANLEPVDADKSEQVHVPEAWRAVQASTLDSKESSVQSPEEEAEPITDEPKQTEKHLTEGTVDPEDKELLVNAVKTPQEPEALESVQAPKDSEEDSVQPFEKDVILEDAPEAKPVRDEPKKEAMPLAEFKLEVVDASKTDQAQEPEVLQTIQAATLDSVEGGVQLLEEEVFSEDILVVETVTEEPKQETEVMTELEEKLPVEATKMEHIQEPEVLQTIQAVTLDSEVGNLLPLEQHVISRHILAVEKVTEEPKQENEVRIEPEEKLLVEASETEHVQEPEALQAVQAVTLASEVGSLLPLEKEVTLEDIPAVESVTDEPKQEMVPLTEVKLEAVDTSKTENVQEPEVLQAVEAPTSDSKAGSLLSLEKEVISEEIPAVETATDEPRQETELRVEPEEKLQTAAAKTEHVQEPESLSSDNATETKTEEGVSMYGHAVTENVEGGEAQELGKQILSDFPNPDADNIIASVTDDIKHDSIPKVIDELQALTAVCVSVNEDVGHVHVLEKTEITKETPTPCEDNAAVTNESKHEVHLSAVQVTETTVDEHAVVALTVPCHFKDVSAAIPDVLIEETAAITEPLIDTVTSELVFKEGVEATTPLVKDAVAETAEESSVVVIMHVPSVEFEDNHTNGVKVVDADIKSAETIVDTVLEAGVTEDKEVIDVCHVMVTKVDNLSATPKLEKELTNEENKVTIQEVIQHVMEHLPGTVPESVVVNLEKKSITQSEMVESESNDMEDQKVMEDSTVTFRERRDEDLAVISNDSGQKVSEDIMQTPGGLEVFIHDHKDNSEETKAEWEKSEAGVTAEEVRSSSEELHVKEMNEEAQITQIDPSLNVTPSDTGLAVPQNTGIISSISNVESPSSQVMSPTSLPSTTEGKGPEKKIEVSEFTVQAVEPVNPTRVKSQEQTELTEITLQTTEITEPATNLDSMERNVITTQHVLLDIEVTETVELVEHIKSTERVTSRVQVTETIQSLQQTEQREVFLSQQVLSEVGDVGTRAEEPVTQKEEENDQDEWMDAEEDIYTQEETEVSLHRVEESPELRTERDQEGFEQKFEMAPSSKTEEKGSQQEMYKIAETCEIDSEGEDFAVALEHPEAETASITTME